MAFEWTKLENLQAGDKIAVFNDGRLETDEIISIEQCGEEKTYDIEVEGSHNFIANGIIAHNSEGANRATADVVMQEYVVRLRMIQEIIGDILETVLFKQLIDEEFGEGQEVPKVKWRPIWEAKVEDKAKYMAGLVQAGIITVPEARLELGYTAEPQEGTLPSQPSQVKEKPRNAADSSKVIKHAWD